MDNNIATPMQVLYEKAEDYGRTSIELFRLKAINKSADYGSSMISQLAIVVVVAMLITSLTIGAALWIGELLGKNYYGFFIIGATYALLALVLQVYREQLLKSPLSNAMIKKMLSK